METMRAFDGRIITQTSPKKGGISNVDIFIGSLSHNNTFFSKK